MNNHKSAATLLTKQKSMAHISGLSHEILCILVAKGDAKQWEVKVKKVSFVGNGVTGFS